MHDPHIIHNITKHNHEQACISQHNNIDKTHSHNVILHGIHIVTNLSKTCSCRPNSKVYAFKSEYIYTKFESQTKSHVGFPTSSDVKNEDEGNYVSWYPLQKDPSLSL